MKPVKHHGQSPAILFIGIILLCGSMHLWADIKSECTQEAEEFGVAPEQFDDYVSACVYSRGGDLADFSPPPEETASDGSASDTEIPDTENLEIPTPPTPEYNQTAY